ncbi:YcgL domain-containing protein [Thaumasiovibrio subtropicus]|uniref:YcgL domain-containing protein n=1 Tax=Thaumasiovibrio subtropicus TaxID=1891207 RepID=UPI000B35F87F|nr:YcgL domain-containing protein [Thaumasiovibrio subtropicus]
MHCAVYKSDKKIGSYLFVEKKDDFSRVPDSLLGMFGHPSLVMVFDIDKRESLAQANIETVRAALKEEGYYLQLPPPAVNLLDEYKEAKKRDN